MENFKYNNITPRTRVSTSLPSQDAHSISNPFNRDDSEYTSLEDLIKLATESGADVGVRINPQFDDKDCNELDITCSMRHDHLDIAEAFGKMPQETFVPSEQVEE